MPAPDVPHRTEVEALFHQALDLPREERASFLDTASPTEAVRRRAEALLAGFEAPDAFLEQPAADHLADALAGDEAHRLGERLGPYRLVEVVGSGGMGIVYRAERADGQFEQEVAIKLVRPGQVAPDVRPRFMRERQILALLDHLGIARILDGGLAPDGRPYVVMEFVRGEPIDAYCDRRRLTIDERLELFLQACAAVEYAHRHLVIHRDLKPSNILVTEGGTVKLLDFGIAKLLEGNEAPIGPEASDAPLTLPQWPRLTPEFAAPEQVRGGAVGTATDAYALGVVLHVLLTGARPLAFERRTLEHVAHVHRTVTPPRPSRRPSLDASAEARATSPVELRRRLRGDLDAIVLHALRKRPEERYGSAEHLASDVRRHLGGLPVRAREGTVGYRARRFVRRHRAAVAAGAAAVFALIGGLSAALWQASVARQEARRATAINDFLIEMVGAPDLQDRDRADLTMATMVARSAPKLDSQFVGLPDVRAELNHLFGRLYHSLGDYDAAGPHLLRALSLRRHLDADPLEVAITLHLLGIVRHMQAHGDSARSYLEEALRIRQEHLSADAPEISESLNALGTAFGDSAYLYQALNLRRKHLGRTPELATTLNNAGLRVAGAGRFEEATAFYHEALEVYREAFGDEHQRIGMVLYNLALLEMELEAYDDAERHFQDGLRMWTDWYGGEHPAVVFYLSSMGTLAYRQGAHGRAEAHFADAIALGQEVLGENHPRTLLAEIGRARVWTETGRAPRAEAALRDVLSRFEKAEGGIHAQALAALGRCLLQQERAEEALSVLADAEEALLRYASERHWNVRTVRADLAAARAATSPRAASPSPGTTPAAPAGR